MIRKVLRWLIRIILALVLVYTAINLIDSDPPENEWRYADLKPASFEAGNGFYTLMALCYPPERDAASEAVRAEIRDTADPLRVEGLTDAAYRERIAPYLEAAGKCPALGDLDPSGALTPPEDAMVDWMVHFAARAAEIQELSARCGYLRDRYADLMAAETTADFSWPSVQAPFPSLSGLLTAARLHTASALISAGEGRWEAGASLILDQVRFCRKLIAGSRLMILNATGKAILEMSLRALVHLMNHPEAPGEIHSRIISELPEIAAEDIGFRNACIYDYLTHAGVIDSIRLTDFGTVHVIGSEMGSGLWQRASELAIGTLIQKNRTRGYLHDYYHHIVAFEFIPPYKWDGSPDDIHIRRTAGWIWWVRNPVGKILTDIAAPAMAGFIHRTYRLVAIHDMTRIIAGMHAAHRPAVPEEKTLKSLDAYRVLDPYAGAPYCYDPGRQVIYSLGENSKDDGGVEASRDKTASDIALPCRLPRTGN